MQAHAAADQVLERLSEGRVEARAVKGLLDRLALLLGRHAVARKRTGAREGCVLREVHDVEGCIPLPERELNRRLERGLHVLIRERYRARCVKNPLHLAAGFPFEGGCDRRHISQRGTHQEKLRMGKREERHLPSPSAVGVCEEVELVHGDEAHVGVGPLGEGLVGEDLGRAADDGCLRVDVRITRHHADVVATEDVDQLEELLRDERLDGSGVVAALTRGEAEEQLADGHERLARARGRAEDHVASRREREERVLLVRPGRDAACLDPGEEAFIGGLGGKPGFGLGYVAVLIGFFLPPAGRERTQRAVGERVEGGICCICCHGGPFVGCTPP